MRDGIGPKTTIQSRGNLQRMARDMAPLTERKQSLCDVTLLCHATGAEYGEGMLFVMKLH